MSKFRNACIVHVMALGVFGSIWACGDDITEGPDTGLPKTDATTDQSAGDGGVDATLGPKLLMTYSATKGELASFAVASKAVASRLSLPGYQQTQKSGADLFLLGESAQDTIAKLDPATGTNVLSSWNVALSDAVDGGESYADPVQVIETAPNKAYVLRFNRNRIATIDPSQSADAGAPTGSIDLSALLQANDHDTHVDMTGAVFDATRKRLYVVLGNIDINFVDPKGYFLLCAGTKSTLIAIDTTNDTLVNLGGTGPGGGVVLNGYNPQQGVFGGTVLDTAGDRIIVFSAGCNPPGVGDAGAGPLQGRLVEAVDLKANTTATLLDANAQDYPGQLLWLDATHAYIQFGFGAFSSTFAWNPAQTTLGAALPATPDVFDYDDAGHILGPQSTYETDGAAGPTNVISVTLADGGTAQLGQNPFLQTGGFVGNATYVP
jgi:hypothetical protein